MMKKFAFLLMILVLPLIAFSQKTLLDWSLQEDKKFTKKFQFTNTMSVVKKDIKSADDLPKLKTVGMLSYSMYQPNFTQKGSSYIRYLTDDGEAFIVDMLYAKALPGIEKGFSNMGIELLDLEEYVNTPEKKTIYANETFEASKLMKVVGNIAKSLGSTVKGYDGKGTPKGQKFIVEVLDPKIYRAIGKFASDMGVDAVVNIEQTIWWDGKTFALGPIKMSIAGPNPVPYDENAYYVKIGPLKGYMEGLIYSSVTVNPPKSYELAIYKKKKLKDVNFEGLDVVYQRILESLLVEMEEEFAKIVK